MFGDSFTSSYKKTTMNDSLSKSFWHFIHIDPILLFLLSILCSVGLFVLYSASNQNIREVEIQAAHFVFAFFVMFIIAQIPPESLKRLAPVIYTSSLILLFIVLILGHIGKGAQRWLNFGVAHLQPAEMMKIGIPLMLAWCYHKIPLPIKFPSALAALPIILLPAFLTARQPDLTTAILLIISGATLLYLAGLSYKIITTLFGALLVSIPLGWFFLHDYQKQRIITFLNPEYDPLGKGYHIIQSKIAIGSGGLIGKGWLNGTQSTLHFLPEHSTDFIFAVVAEEFGFIGCVTLIAIYTFIILRGLNITINAQDTFSRLTAGSITFTFFISLFINIGMVVGIFPVAGIPLPLISYGGSSMVTIMASFGILMSIQTHRKLVTS